LRSPKRGDVVAEEIKRCIALRDMKVGDKLPKEADLQAVFSVSKGTIREALKSLEVQSLIRVSTGPAGGARIVEVEFDRTFQLLQNYLFFKNVTIEDIYQLRRVLEPELAAGAVPHLRAGHFAALETSIATCAPLPASASSALRQRQEDLHFHDIMAEANPNPLLRFVCQMINQFLRHLVSVGVSPAHELYRRFGCANVRAHKDIVAAARRRDAGKVRGLMLAHVIEAERHVQRLQGALRRRLVLDSDIRMSMLPRSTSEN